tara:strand:- start:423 stop:548 length:126 start_codon:yes stop_codon:yes gene_type:complete
LHELDRFISGILDPFNPLINVLGRGFFLGRQANIDDVNGGG